MSKQYVVIPGSDTHELPPLFVRGPLEISSREELVERAGEIVESEDIIPDEMPSEKLRTQRKLDLALHLADQYSGLLTHWNWGDSILEWIRQCEITFASRSALRNILHNDIWPHAGRASFVDLLLQKQVSTPGVGVEKSGRTSIDISPAATNQLFFEPVPVLSEFHRSWKCIRCLASHGDR